ncbi:uncharacterized protein VTP21DRAFT_10345 [Calcarisporiella thermophila]|uniref:uncharacterized protein n=1 Tax=Calcarisporiella thermophila TaxID=911321 RepID=UPI003742B2BB
MSSPIAASDRRKRRAIDPKPDKFAKLRELKKSGDKYLKHYKVGDAEEIFEEVNEEDFRSLIRQRQAEDDFVENDDDGGYVDNGLDAWEEEPYEEYSDEEKEAGSKRKRDKSEKKKTERVRSKQMINSFFKKKADSSIEPKKVTVTQDDSDFMANLLGDLEDDIDPSSTSTRVRPKPAPTPIFKLTKPKEFDLDLDLNRPSSSVFDLKTTEAGPTAKVSAKAPIAIVKSENDAEKNEALSGGAVDPFDDEFGDMPLEDISIDIMSEVEKSQPEHATNGHVKSEDRMKHAKPSYSDDMSQMLASMREHAAPLSVEGSFDKSEDTPELGEDELQMYWFDAFENTQEKERPIYLFGKVQDKASSTYVSCCVRVTGVKRNLFVLPRPFKLDDQGNETQSAVSMMDVYEELDAICTRHKIMKWAAKEVERKYAFELPGIPAESNYLKIEYDFDQPQLPSDLSGKTFSRIFGTNTNAQEHFIIKRNLMGPCWLRIGNAVQVREEHRRKSWCRLEFTLDDPKSIRPIEENPPEDPPLCALSLNLRTVVNHRDHMYEVVVASALIFPNLSLEDTTPIERRPHSRFTAIRQLSDVRFPVGFLETLKREKMKVDVTQKERALLDRFVSILRQVDPDVLIGHNIIGFDLDVLLHRMKATGVEEWSRLGRLRRRQWPKFQNTDSTYIQRMIVSGRLICDTYLAAKDLVRSKSYSLQTLALTQLRIQREDMGHEKVPECFSNARELVHLIQHCEFDAFLSGKLMERMQVLPLTRQLTRIAGNLWGRTLTGGRAERNEYLLLHEFHRRKYICPDKNAGKFAKKGAGDAEEDEEDNPKSRGSRRKPAYAGGLVLDPKRGLYDKYVLLLDFNSLYPSIIQEYNVCFTTVERKKGADVEDQTPDVPSSSVEEGILPRLLGVLVERRRQVKGLMKDPKLTLAEHTQLDIRQKALKLTANSMYGCLGFTGSRFYAKPLAMLITSKGREILQNTVDLAESIHLNVIYGDTDSIMIYTDKTELDEVKRIGNDLKRLVNERYRRLEIEMDGFFRRMLLLKKKKYAALVTEERADGTVETTMETKGLDLVRRDWCGLSHDVSGYVLKQILSSVDKEEVVNRIHEHLSEVSREARLGNIPIEKFVIYKNLTKPPEHYTDAKGQPHVQVALRMKARGQMVRAGETIPYVICLSESEMAGKSFAERAYHPEDLLRNESLKIDLEWYLQQQVHPPVARLCDPIEGTDGARIADCLGLDPAKFRSTTSSTDERAQTLESQIPDEERFKLVDKFQPRCAHCGERREFVGVVRENKPEEETQGKPSLSSGLVCPECAQIMPLASLEVQLIGEIRSHITRYYEGWMVCDDQSCQHRTRMISVYGRRCLNQGCRGSMAPEYTDSALYTQLVYYSSLVDIEKAKKRASGDIDMQEMISLIDQHYASIEHLKRSVKSYIERSQRRYVDLGQLFRFAIRVGGGEVS